MTQWIPWQPGQAVEEWAKDGCLATTEEDGETFVEVLTWEIDGWTDINGMAVDYQKETVTAYARKPAPYKPVVGIAVGQVRRTPLGVEIEVSRSRKMSDERTLCKIRLADCYTIYERVPTDDLATWPVVRVEQDDDK